MFGQKGTPGWGTPKEVERPEADLGRIWCRKHPKHRFGTILDQFWSKFACISDSFKAIVAAFPWFVCYVRNVFRWIPVLYFLSKPTCKTLRKQLNITIWLQNFEIENISKEKPTKQQGNSQYVYMSSKSSNIFLFPNLAECARLLVLVSCWLVWLFFSRWELIIPSLRQVNTSAKKGSIHHVQVRWEYLRSIH